jgi:hypothetical protein
LWLFSYVNNVGDLMAGVKGKSGRRPEMKTIKQVLAEALESNAKAIVDKAVSMAKSGDKDMIKALIEWGVGKPRQTTEVTGRLDLGLSAGELNKQLAEQVTEDAGLLDCIELEALPMPAPGQPTGQAAIQKPAALPYTVVDDSGDTIAFRK